MTADRLVSRRSALAGLGLGIASVSACGSATGISNAKDGVHNGGSAVFGAYSSPADHPIERPQNAAAARAFARALRINHRFLYFEDQFPSRNEFDDRSAGQLSMVSWLPHGIRLGDIADGRYDDLLRRRGREVASFGSPIMIRFGHEMNGNWYTWSSQQSSSAALGNTPDRFVAAWRRAREIFRESGARNASWVWCPNAVDIPRDNDFAQYYPGSAHVDWVGLDVYTSDYSRRETPQPATFASLVRNAAARLDETKPMIIAEFGFAGSESFRVHQFASVAPVVRATPTLRALVYFDRTQFSPTGSARIRTAARNMAASPELSSRSLERAR